MLDGRQAKQWWLWLEGNGSLGGGWLVGDGPGMEGRELLVKIVEHTSQVPGSLDLYCVTWPVVRDGSKPFHPSVL